MGRKVYHIKYKMHFSDEVHGIDVLAQNKEDAWDQATYGDIPYRHNGEIPYSAWVYSVTYNNGNHRLFNTCEGLPY